ncbi:serine/threonine protein kinase [Chitinophaga terrae (ex Kim and Jung 2007)]|uniref:lanthionine synthetase LanC family protein n=1 Tax=Chitinophaga terrae (ex Kim and Jung 2007) TaxID=408074 RepID=UPI00278A61BF|nr:lanthionine synthetase LanC family protein [Chitinophaga terrae (ex Kim and Jung 2007)]MDQ0107493.1 serine/threonine protein kinase [Chitinophaga terrae (ex Kim and Jung 2007)]
MDSTTAIRETGSNPLLNAVVDYSVILANNNATYDTDNLYYTVRFNEWNKGWVLHLSAVLPQVVDMLSTVVPLLMEQQVSFKIVKNKEIAIAQLNGHLGLPALGKLVFIYPACDEQALSIAERLNAATSLFRGPKVLTDYRLGPVLYTGFQGDVTGGDNIPFQMPAGVSWPFNSIVSLEVQKGASLLGGKYYVVTELKKDAKGNVYKVMGVKSTSLFRTCVVKEGKMHMACDEHGRDIRDRLLWQKQLHEELYGELPVPKVVDFFEENGDTFFVMEYIRGQQLDGVIVSLFEQKVWSDLNLDKRRQLIDFALQIVSCAEVMHKKGYAHRDINTVNFLVTKKNRLVMIDIELAYSQKESYPDPPFMYGTFGFMSPEQQAVKTPTIKEDIYAIGATLISLFTGLLPGKFETSIPGILIEQLDFFIPDKQIVDLIATCLSEDPEQRPVLPEIKAALAGFYDRQLVSVSNPILTHKADKTQVEEVIKNALLSLSTPTMAGQDGIWFSKIEQQAGQEYNQVHGIAYYGGFFAGVAGVMYLVAEAKKLGYDVKPLVPYYTKSLEFIMTSYLQNMEDQPASLSSGMAGIALALTMGIDAGLIGKNPTAVNVLESMLQSGNFDGLSLARGKAGQGIALLGCTSILNAEFVEYVLGQQVSFILNKQDRDGSWKMMPASGRKKEIEIGLMSGVAGIVLFLLAFLKRYSNKDVEDAVLKALNWLKRASRRNKHRFDTPLSMEYGLSNGSAGIALVFIRAYKVFKDDTFRKTADELMEMLPPHLNMKDLSQGNGLAGIGEVYLEAADVFKANKYENRVEWITATLMHEFRMSNGGIYWIVEDSPITTASYMMGNSGILHFLLRCLQPNTLRHPLFH